jgi:hypothetical protein
MRKPAARNPKQVQSRKAHRIWRCADRVRTGGRAARTFGLDRFVRSMVHPEGCSFDVLKWSREEDGEIIAASERDSGIFLYSINGNLLRSDGCALRLRSPLRAVGALQRPCRTQSVAAASRTHDDGSNHPHRPHGHTLAAKQALVPRASAESRSVDVPCRVHHRFHAGGCTSQKPCSQRRKSATAGCTLRRTRISPSTTLGRSSR